MQWCRVGPSPDLTAPTVWSETVPSSGRLVLNEMQCQPEPTPQPTAVGLAPLASMLSPRMSRLGGRNRTLLRLSPNLFCREVLLLKIL